MPFIAVIVAASTTARRPRSTEWRPAATATRGACGRGLTPLLGADPGAEREQPVGERSAGPPRSKRSSSGRSESKAGFDAIAGVQLAHAS